MHIFKNSTYFYYTNHVSIMKVKGVNTMNIPICHSSSNTSNNVLKRTDFSSFLLASLLGVLFHFVYDWTGENTLVGFFVPVNESTWEHLKLIFFPILLVSMAEYALTEYTLGGKLSECFSCIKFQSALLGMLTVVILFYTYSGILGTNFDWLNILTYFLGMAVAYGYSYKKRNTYMIACNSTLCIIGASVIVILFMIFSIYPPSLGLFQAPTVG